jgi:hypothetical protein
MGGAAQATQKVLNRTQSLRTAHGFLTWQVRFKPLRIRMIKRTLPIAR